MTQAVSANALSFSFTEKKILSDLSFSLQQGESVAIIGSSGCGKSTLLKLLHRLLPADEGSITLEGRSSLLFQDDRLLPWRTCSDNIRLSLNQRGTDQQQQTEQINNLLIKMNIPRVAQLYPSALSGGMRQRVALARAMINAPDVLLLDEPFAAIDHLNRQTLISELRQLLQTTPVTMVLVTHDIDEALFLSNHIFVLGGAPTSIQHSLSLPETPQHWQHFYQSKAMIDLKVHILQLLGQGNL